MKSKPWFCCCNFPMFPFCNLNERIIIDALIARMTNSSDLTARRFRRRSREEALGHLASFTTPHAIAMGTPYFPRRANIDMTVEHLRVDLWYCSGCEFACSEKMCLRWQQNRPCAHSLRSRLSTLWTRILK